MLKFSLLEREVLSSAYLHVKSASWRKSASCGKYYLQPYDEVLHRAFLAQLVLHPKKYSRSSKGSFPSRVTFTRFVRALRKFSVQFTRSTWQSNFSKFARNTIQLCSRAVWEGHESLVDKKLGGLGGLGGLCGSRVA